MCISTEGQNGTSKCTCVYDYLDKSTGCMDIGIKKWGGGSLFFCKGRQNTDIDKWVRYVFVGIAISPT